ncbi:protease HtpX [Candidatus Saccharibacteria bacterium]|nr:MAG: protease HtpX [Candidatus Saccharibacteria bacterium]
MTQIFKTTLLLGLLTGIFMGVGYALNGQSGALMALFFAGITNFGMFWFSDKIVLKMQGAKPLDPAQHPEIVRMVQELTTADNLPMPKLYIVETPVPNAFATGRSPHHAAVAVHTGIIDLLTYDELKAVLGHELGHVKNRDMLVSTVAATLAGAVSFLAQMAFFMGGNDREGGINPIAAIAMVILAPLAATMVQMAVSRSREFLADEHGAHLLGTGKDLASALQKLDNFKQHAPKMQPTPTQQATAHLMFANMFSPVGFASLFSTHPRTADRVARLNRISEKIR